MSIANNTTSSNHTQTAGFTQVPNRIIEHSTASLAAKMVYITLLKYSREKDEAFPSQATLARELNTSVRSIHTYLAELEKHALITIQRRGRTQANLYRLTESVSSDRRYLQVRPAESAGTDLQYLPTNNKQYKQYESNKTVASHKAEQGNYDPPSPRKKSKPRIGTPQSLRELTRQLSTEGGPGADFLAQISG